MTGMTRDNEPAERRRNMTGRSWRCLVAGLVTAGLVLSPGVAWADDQPATQQPTQTVESGARANDGAVEDMAAGGAATSETGTNDAGGTAQGGVAGDDTVGSVGGDAAGNDSDADHAKDGAADETVTAVVVLYPSLTDGAPVTLECAVGQPLTACEGFAGAEGTSPNGGAFLGWYRDTAFTGDAVDANEPVREAMSLYARWEGDEPLTPVPDSSTQTGDSGSANNGTADGTGAADDQDNDGNTAADSQQSESKGFLGAIVDFFTSLLGDNADSDSNEGNAGADNGSGNFNDGTDTSSDASDTASQNNFNEGSDADADGSDADAESDPAPAAPPTADELAQLDDAVTVTVPGMADVQSADLKLADGTYTIGQVASDDNGGWTVPIAISPASYLVAGAKALQQANPNLKASGLDLDANATQSVITLVYRPAMSFDFDFSGKGGDRSAPSRSWQLATPATVALSLRDGVNADAATLAADGKGLDLNQIKDLLKLVKTYTLKFDSNGGTPVLPQVGVVAQIEIVPGHPTKLPVSNVLVVSIACRKITDSMNISQEQCKQFLSNFGVAKEPAAPKRLGYTFAGWYTDAALTTPFTAWNKAITDNQTLHAKWTRSSFTVRFDSNGGTVVLPRTVKAGEPMTSLPTPKRAFRQFDGWYTDKTWSKRWTTDDPVTSDMTLVAHWVKKNFLVTFDSNWGTPVLPQLVRNGGTVTRPEDPVRAMRYFDGWYTDKTWTTRYDFSQPVTSNMTLVAHWVKNAPGKCAVRYRGMPIGVTNPNSVQVECLPDGEGNYTFTLKSPSVRKGYEFLGWHWQVEAADVPSDALTEGDADVSEDGTTTLTVPSNTDITLTPRWETAADDKPAGKPDDKPGQQPGDNVSGDDNSNGDGNNDGNGSANGGSSSNGSSPNGSAGNNSGSANGSQTGASNVTNGSGSQQTSAKQTSGQGSNQSNPLAITGAAVSVVAAIALVAAIIGVALVVERKRN